MANTVQLLTGALPLVIIIATILTGIAAATVLRLYRRAVVREMNRALKSAQPTPDSVLRRSPPSVPPLLQLQWLGPASQVQLDSGPALVWQRSVQAHRRRLWTELAAGAMFSLVMTVAWLLAAGAELKVSGILWMLACFVWPVVPAISVVSGPGRERWRWPLFGYVLCIVLLVMWLLTIHADLSLIELVLLWCIANAPASVLLLIFGNRRVRAAGPMVLIVMVAGLSGVVAMLQLGLALQLEGTMGVLLEAAGFCVFAAAGWLVLRWLGRRYVAKRIGAQEITLDAIWMLFAIGQSFTLVFQGLWWVLTAPIAFGAYKAVSLSLTKRTRRSADSHQPPPMLLLLRVFALGSRGEALLETIRQRWLPIGTVSLIAGPDLATVTAAPQDLLAFIGGKLSREFIADDADLERRRSAFDRDRDPDGRFRVTEMFCHANTWQPAMVRFAKDASVVLMDLRSFSAANQGCLYELRQLLSVVPVHLMILLVDDTTNRAFLEETLAREWRDMPESSPNRAGHPTVLRVVSISRRRAPDFVPLMRAVFATTSP